MAKRVRRLAPERQIRWVRLVGGEIHWNQFKAAESVSSDRRLNFQRNIDGEFVDKYKVSDQKALFKEAARLLDVIFEADEIVYSLETNVVRARRGEVWMNYPTLTNSLTDFVKKLLKAIESKGKPLARSEGLSIIPK